MSLRDDIRRYSLTALGAFGEAVTGLAGGALQKADDSRKPVGDDSPSTSMGGSQEDTVASNPVPQEPAKDDPKSLLWDPFAIVEQLGYKDKPSNMTYGTLKAILYKMPIVGAIVQTRINQVAAFCTPPETKYDLGFKIKLRDHDKEPTKAEKNWIQQAQTMMLRTGVTENPRGREDLETFVKKLVFDSLVYDQMCHPAGTHVQVEMGSKPIEDICVGQRVWTHEGRLAQVTELTQRTYSGNLYSIRGRGQVLSATEGHPLLVVADTEARFRETIDPVWMGAKDVRPGMYLVYPRVRLLEREVATPWGPLTAELACVLGLYAANGHEQRGVVTFTLHEDAVANVVLVEKVFGELGYSVVITPYENRAAVSVRVNSGGDRRLADFFHECGNGAEHKQVPFCIWEASREWKAHFIAGYLRGDGYIAKSGARFSTVSRQLFEGLRLLLADQDIYAARREILEGGVRGSGWNNQHAASISGRAYEQLCLRTGLYYEKPGRPREPVLTKSGYFLIKVNSVEVESVQQLPVFNFEVEKDHSYLAEGYVSHNCFEVVPNRKGTPAEWYAVDGSTMRLADTASTVGNEDDDKAVRYVQIYDGMIIAEYNQEEMCFAIRNPRSDIRLQGYGISELEMLVPTITSLLYSFEFNQKFFTQGSAAKGIINFKGAVSEKQMQNFRKQWYTQIASVQNAWRTPIVNSEDLQYVNLQQSARDMEFAAWMDFQIKLACAMFLIDPVEVNFKYGNVGQKSGLHESNNKEKITESKERGLRPLLRHVSKCINKHILWPINESFEFAFVGLDAETKGDLLDMNQKRVKTYMTVDELRAEEDMEPLPDGKGEVILDPTYLQFAQMKEGGGGAPGQFGEDASEENGGGQIVAQGDEDNTDYERMLRQYENEDEAETAKEEQSDAERAEAQKSLTKSWVVNL